MKIKHVNISYLFVILYLVLPGGCTLFDEAADLDLGDHTYQLAVPLVNTKATVGYLAENATGNITLRVDASGKTTLFFNGEVLRRSTANFFPPFPGLAGIPITDTIFSYLIPFKNNPEIKKASFKNTNLYFFLEHDKKEDITVRMVFKNLRKNGIPFEKVFSMKYQGAATTSFTSEKFNVDGWIMESENNSLDIYYEAFTKSGEKFVLNRAELYFDFIQFAYMEGYIGYHISPVSGSLIDINLFDKWLSGTFDFENPKVSIIVENSFGFPVRSKVNRMDLVTVSDKVIQLESEFISKGIDFRYPGINEIGQSKLTYFSFDKTNSNIREIFNEKTKRIEYDISAEINPEKDPSIQGFLDENSSYTVYVAAEIPLQGTVNEVVVTDTLSFDPSFLKGVKKAGLKINLENTFPMDLTADIYFLDENRNRIYSLFSNESLYLVSPGLDASGKVKKGNLVKRGVALDQQAVETLKQARFVTIVGKIDTVENPSGEPVWIYDENGLLLQIGALIDYEK